MQNSAYTKSLNLELLEIWNFLKFGAQLVCFMSLLYIGETL